MTSQRVNIPSFGIRSKQPSQLPIIDNVVGKTDSTPGVIKLGEADDLLYFYNNRKQWLPLAIDHGILQPEDDCTAVIKAPSKWGLHLRSGNNPHECGGDIHISSGIGGIADGEIYFDIGGENVLIIKKTGVISVKRDMVFSDGACVRSVISREELTVDGDEPEEVTMDGSMGILLINLELKNDDIYSGIIKNKLIKEDSWMGLTITSDVGTPSAWFSEQKDGSIRYTIRCVKGELFVVNLHFSVCN